MKKIAYTYAVLRYVHDVVSGEFANVGVAVFAPSVGFASATCTATYGRVSRFFGGVEAEHFKKLMRRIQYSVEGLGDRMNAELPFDAKAKDVRGLLDRLLPPDDSSLQFSESMRGVTDDPHAALEELFERYVNRHVRPHRLSRTDDEVRRVYREPLAAKHVLSRLYPRTFAGDDYEHEFPWSWKNGRWNASEAVSFDLLHGNDILEKANRWLGRAYNLAESPESFKLYLLMGAPKDEKLKDVFIRAQNILHKMPIEHAFVREDEADGFAEQVASEIEGHSAHPESED